MNAKVHGQKGISPNQHIRFKKNAKSQCCPLLKQSDDWLGSSHLIMKA